ncbi:MAG: ferrochelatase [Planctomycetota bacterium]|jgi:ferrochelatase
MTGKTGILLLQLGTPDAPTASALRRYLGQFLSDPRVVDWPKLIWRPVLNLIILTFRPRKSAAKYKLIWNDQSGSPLMSHSRKQAELLQQKFPNIPIELGMTYGNPSVDSAIDKLRSNGIDRIIALPMFPQYSATTTAAATDALFKSLVRQEIKRVPDIRVIPPYPEFPAYIEALAISIEEDLRKIDWDPEHFIISFHGIPKRYCKQGDIYATHVKQTTRKLVERMGWKRGSWRQTFQSRFGPETWLKPYTDDYLKELASNGIRKVFVVAPGFTADCLETIDEIGREFLEEFHEKGGEQIRLCPCLNDHPLWISAMHELISSEGTGWI